MAGLGFCAKQLPAGWPWEMQGPLHAQHFGIYDPLLKKGFPSRSLPCELTIIKAAQRDPAEVQI